MTALMTLGEMLASHARIRPEMLAAADSARILDSGQLNERGCRLANGLGGLGLVKGDRVAVLAFNCVEWAEIYAGTAKAGLVAVPIIFRLLGAEIAYIVQDAKAAAIIVQAGLEEKIESVREELPCCGGRFIRFGGVQIPSSGYLSYEALLAKGVASEPDVAVGVGDPWAFMNTSRTTGIRWRLRTCWADIRRSRTCRDRRTAREMRKGCMR